MKTLKSKPHIEELLDAIADFNHEMKEASFSDDFDEHQASAIRNLQTKFNKFKITAYFDWAEEKF